MKAIQIMAPQTPVVVDVPVPEIADNEVLVQVAGCVTCPHWDLTIFKGIDIFDRPGYPIYPIPWGYPGHEMAGKIAAKGSKVTGFEIGDRIASVVNGGERSPGYYAEFINMPQQNLVKVPDHISDEAAASMEMARYVYAYTRLARTIKGLRTGVIGCGPAGLIAVQIFKALGASEVVAVDVLPERLELARKLGATDTVNSATDELQKLKEHPFQLAMDCSGIAAGQQLAVDYTPFGQVILFGVTHGTVTYGTKNWGTSILAGINPTDEDTQCVIDLWNAGQLDTGALATASLPFSRYADGIGLLMNRSAVKVYYYPD